jgi:hypothetical protein
MAASFIRHHITPVLNLADKLKKDSYVGIVRKMVDGFVGAETPGVAPTPQKRGPPPIPSWRGGRLPNLLAAECRPTLWGYPRLLLLSICRNIIATQLVTETLRTVR